MSPKSFTILAGATAISLALAGWAIATRDKPMATTQASAPLFPGLLDRVNDVRTVRLITPGGKLTIAAKDGGGWKLDEKGGYPVEPQQVRDLVLALANLQLVEAKTSDPDRLKRLELEEPGVEGAKSRSIELDDQSGTALAAAVVGKPKPGLYGGGRGGIYVRRAGDDQAWLAAGEIELPADALSLLDQRVIDIPMEQVAAVTLQPAGAAPVRLHRPDAKTATFTADAAPPDGRALDASKVEQLAGSLANLTMEDVRPASELTLPADAAKARFETFDGVAVDVIAARLGDGDAAENWLELAVAAAAPATGEPSSADAATTRAATLGARTQGWAFKVAPYVADRLHEGLDQLLAEPSSGS